MLLKLTSLTEVNKSSCNILRGIYHLLHADHQCPCQACLYLACPVVMTRCTDILKSLLKSLCSLTTDRCPTKNNPPPTIRMLRINVKAPSSPQKRQCCLKLKVIYPDRRSRFSADVSSEPFNVRNLYRCLLSLDLRLGCVRGYAVSMKKHL